jgi:hypothetical protein
MLCAILDDRRPAGAPHDRLISFVADRPGHDLRYAIDPARIRAELGWRPSVTLEEGLARTVDWYLANEDWWRPLLERPGVGQRLGLGQGLAAGGGAGRRGMSRPILVFGRTGQVGAGLARLPGWWRWRGPRPTWPIPTPAPRRSAPMPPPR